MTCSALTRDGIADIWQTVLDHRALVESNGWFARRREEQSLEWMREALLYGLEHELRRDASIDAHLAAMRADVRSAAG